MYLLQIVKKRDHPWKWKFLHFFFIHQHLSRIKKITIQRLKKKKKYFAFKVGIKSIENGTISCKIWKLIKLILNDVICHCHFPQPYKDSPGPEFNAGNISHVPHCPLSWCPIKSFPSNFQWSVLFCKTENSLALSKIKFHAWNSPRKVNDWLVAALFPTCFRENT